MPTAVAAARQSYADHPMVRLETAPPGPCHAVSLQETLSGTFTACATVILANVEETSSELWDEIMGINAKGVFLGTKYAIPEMRKNGGGSIVNISSVAGLIGTRYSAAYGASKGAVRLLTKSTAIQYAKDNIRANSIHPGVIETPMTAPNLLADEQARQITISRHPIGRLGQPEDVAYGALFLASDESSFMTGSELVIDGGLTAQ